MRAFISVEFSSDLKRLISEIQSKLRPISSKGRFKHVDNFHLTLKFLGEVNDIQIDKINKELCSVAEQNSQFVLRLEGLGSFASRGIIRTLWLGVNGETEKLYFLQKSIDKALALLGFPIEAKPFKPHVTIGQDIILTEDFSNVQSALGKIELPYISVDRVFLIKSQQISGKRIYTPLNQHILS